MRKSIRRGAVRVYETKVFPGLDLDGRPCITYWTESETLINGQWVGYVGLLDTYPFPIKATR